MVNPKVEIFSNFSIHNIQMNVNEFLSKLDVRQIVKTEWSSSYNGSGVQYSCIIMYIGIDDIRDIKIDNILDKGI